MIQISVTFSMDSEEDWIQFSDYLMDNCSAGEIEFDDELINDDERRFAFIVSEENRDLVKNWLAPICHEWNCAIREYIEESK